MNALVLSDNSEVLQNLKPIFERRKINRWTFTDSDSLNPKKDFKHIIDNYDIVFSAHCRKIFPKILTDSVRCVNIHPGFNPHNRGMYPHVFSIVNGLPAGVTIHEISEEIDNGPIIIRRQVGVKNTDTSETLYNRIIKCELELLDEQLDRIIENKYTPTVTSSGNYNSMEDFKRLCKIELSSVGTFQNFYDLLRALSHGEYKNAKINDTFIKLQIL